MTRQVCRRLFRGAERRALVAATPDLTLPGLRDAHSHAFQRALRGRAAGGDFWAWREAMLAEAARQTPEPSVRYGTRTSTASCAPPGYTAVGEFHYLGRPRRARRRGSRGRGRDRVRPASTSAYARGGLPRMRQASVADYLEQVEALRGEGIAVGLAPHSVRACPRDWLEEIGRYAEREPLPLHVHACEQPREIEECLAEHGCRPIELLARHRLPRRADDRRPRDHADGGELDLLASHGADDLRLPDDRGRSRRRLRPRRPAPSSRRSRSASAPTRTCGSTRFEELRELEGIARRQSGRRGVFPTEALLEIGSASGGRALGLADWPSSRST